MAKRRGRPSPVDSERNREAAVTMETVGTPGAVIAERLGVARQTVSAWRQEPEYQQAVTLSHEERRKLASDLACLVLGSLWVRYVDQALQQAADGSLTLRDLREELEFAHKWAGVHPPEPAANDNRGPWDIIREAFQRKRADVAREE